MNRLSTIVKGFAFVAVLVQTLFAVTINYRSIGTNTTILNQGTVTVALGATIVTLPSGAFPENIGQGDEIVFEPGTGPNKETCYILSRNSSTSITLQATTKKTHSNILYQIKRAFNTPQAWADSRGNQRLVALNYREVGVCYKDGVFDGPLLFGNRKKKDKVMPIVT